MYVKLAQKELSVCHCVLDRGYRKLFVHTYKDKEQIFWFNTVFLHLTSKMGATLVGKVCNGRPNA